jgi:heme O synthase-like polyprenyltransferase
MCLLWAALAITLNHSMSWIKRSYWLAAILGSITGPLSYLAGVKLGAGTMPNQSISLIALGLIWAMAMPLMVKWSKLATEKI